MMICRVGVGSLHEDRKTDRHDKAKSHFLQFLLTHTYKRTKLILSLQKGF